VKNLFKIKATVKIPTISEKFIEGDEGDSEVLFSAGRMDMSFDEIFRSKLAPEDFLLSVEKEAKEMMGGGGSPTGTCEIECFSGRLDGTTFYEEAVVGRIKFDFPLPEADEAPDA